MINLFIFLCVGQTYVVYSYVCVQLHMPVCACTEARGGCQVSLEAGFLTEPGAKVTASKLQQSDSSGSPTQSWGDRHTQPCLSFYVGSGDSESTCTQLTDPSFHPLKIIILTMFVSSLARPSLALNRKVLFPAHIL